MEGWINMMIIINRHIYAYYMLPNTKNQGVPKVGVVTLK